jgi:hypothetical protein
MKSRITFQGDPFELVERDLNATKEFAINNIVRRE